MTMNFLLVYYLYQDWAQGLNPLGQLESCNRKVIVASWGIIAFLSSIQASLNLSVAFIATYYILHKWSCLLSVTLHIQEAITPTLHIVIAYTQDP